ncbi:MAG: TonB family protein [Sphingobium sp.]
MTGTTGANSAGTGGYRSGRSPIGLGGAVAVHGAVLVVFLLMPKEMITQFIPTTLTGTNIPVPPPPPEVAEDRPKPGKIDTNITTTDPIISAKTAKTVIIPPAPPFDPGTLGGSGREIVIPPPADPVFTEAQIDRSALAGFQPDYPAAMVRREVEGSVTVRVEIGPDGRVIDIERLSTTDEAFWQATMRHALRKWRFRPATRDGVPISSSKTLTVHFRLT